MRKYLEIGGVVATVVLIVFGVVAIALGVNGRNTVRDSLKSEQIVGTPDMTKAGIAAEAKAAGLPASIKLPTANIAGKAITTGALARDFATYMRIHALEASGGLPYSQMPRYATADGKGTNDAAKATKGADGQPLDNAARNVWVTETALSTALNASFLAENVALFGIVTGVAFLLTGFGFGILVLFGVAPRPRTGDSALRQAQAEGSGDDHRSRRVGPAHLRRRAAWRRPAFVSSTGKADELREHCSPIARQGRLMLGVRDTRRVAWRRQHARRHYVGYVSVTEETVRLAGREQTTGIDVSLSIPHAAIRTVRVGSSAAELLVGEPAVVLELRDEEPIYVRPLGDGPLDLDGFARRFRTQ